MDSSAFDGLRVTFNPESGWAEADAKGPLSPLMLAYMLLAILPIAGRSMGHLLIAGCWTVPTVLFEGIIYSCFLFFMTIVMGLFLVLLAEKFSAGFQPSEGIRLAFMASTPLWIAGLLFAIPILAVQILISVIVLAHMGYLLLVGAHHFLGARPDRAVTVLSIGFGLWALVYLLLAQVAIPFFVTPRC